VNLSSAGFNGNNTFPDITTYSNAPAGIADGSPTQYSINDTPSGAAATVPVTMVDAGLYVQDDWKVRPNLTLSGGLRFETQNAIHDHADWRRGWALRGALAEEARALLKTVLRGGFGLFYDRIQPKPDSQRGSHERSDAARIPCFRSELSDAGLAQPIAVCR